jgi:antitoxin PrlF
VVILVWEYYKEAVMRGSRARGARPIASSRLTSKGQATVPAPVRKKLDLKPGDTVVFEEVEKGLVCIRKAEALDLEFLSALEQTLSEWNSDNDEQSYSDL